MTTVFLEQFLMVSEAGTVACLAALAALIVFMWRLQRRKVSFSTRVLLATGLGLALGLAVQAAAGFPEDPLAVRFLAETATWYGMVGNGFIDLIRMLVIPLIMVSIVNVIVAMKGDNLRRLTKNTLAATMIMVAISVVVGLAVGMVFHLGVGRGGGAATAEIKAVRPIAQTLQALLPANPVAAMLETNIIALVIFAAFFGAAARRMGKKYPDAVRPFNDLVAALLKIITSVAMYVIKLMPYAVVAMLANTILRRGVRGIAEVAAFILALYLGLAIMFVIQLIALAAFGIGPGMFLRKGLDPMLMAFTSRSSVGTLPVTLATLTRKMGVSEGTANFVASFNTTAGMQGCAGVFPAMLVVFVARAGGQPIDVTFLVMSLIVIAIGSLGIAGIPGTATMAASVALSGTGMAASFPLISPILAIDPIIDMGRSALNVTGAMVNALIVDKRLGLLDQAAYDNAALARLADDEAADALEGGVA